MDTVMGVYGALVMDAHMGEKRLSTGVQVVSASC